MRRFRPARVFPFQTCRQFESALRAWPPALARGGRASRPPSAQAPRLPAGENVAARELGHGTSDPDPADFHSRLSFLKDLHDFDHAPSPELKEFVFVEGVRTWVVVRFVALSG